MSGKFKGVSKANKSKSPLLDAVTQGDEDAPTTGRPKEFEELVKLNFYIPPDLKEKFKTLTKKQGASMGHTLREFVEAYVEKHTDD